MRIAGEFVTQHARWAQNPARRSDITQEVIRAEATSTWTHNPRLLIAVSLAL